jgi:Leucine rich repeat
VLFVCEASVSFGKVINCSQDPYSVRFPNKCMIGNDTLDEQDITISSLKSTAIEFFEIENNKNVKFLPVDVGVTFPQLIEFKVADCKVRTVESNIFTHMNNLTNLQLIKNEISHIAEDAFDDLKKLKDLDLSYNKLETLSSKLFYSLSCLEGLYLDHNNITKLGQHLLEKNLGLTHISIQINQLKTLHEDFFNSTTKLQSVSLQKNQINVLSSKLFENKEFLERVDLRGNVCVNVTFSIKFESEKMKQHFDSNCTSRFINESSSDCDKDSNSSLISSGKIIIFILLCIFYVLMFILLCVMLKLQKLNLTLPRND